MPEIIEQYYAPLLKGHGFIPDPDNQQYGSLGISWKLSPEIGEGSYWTYGQKDLYDIKIHNFSFHEDSLLEFSLPECLSITRYDSISGEELAPYRRLSAGCIKTYIGGYSPYRVLIHKNIPIRSIGVEIMPPTMRIISKSSIRTNTTTRWRHSERSTRQQTSRKCPGSLQSFKITAEMGSPPNCFMRAR